MSEDASFGNMELPVITVFGAGIAGLTAAHELVERGFEVQVVEPSSSPSVEYECAVGGLAANQFSRVRAPFQVLHPWLMSDNTLNLAWVLGFRDWSPKIEASATRYPLLQKLRFDRNKHQPSPPVGRVAEEPFDPRIRSRLEPQHPAPEDWMQYWDAHGSLNIAKLDEVFLTIRRASRHNMRLYFPVLAAELDKNPDFTTDNWAPYCPVYRPDTKVPPTSADVLARKFIARETYCVRIVAYTDADSTQDQNRKLAEFWAGLVKKWLLDRNAGITDRLKAAAVNATAYLDQPIWELENRLEIVVRGSADARPTADPRARSLANRVEFEVVEQIIPGEHGFRFFPGFYRHLFDTMKRTPVFDDRGIVQSTAYNQLVQTPGAQLSLPGGLHDFDLGKITSLSQGKRGLDLITGKLGLKPTDLLGLTVKTFRFLTSGPKRRQNQTETINLVQYIGGDDVEKLYSPPCLKFIDSAPRALAAMSARESDARTQYAISIQLGLPNLPNPATLNGPTSIAWLDPWKAYLKHRGVKFFVGRLVGMEPVKPADWPGETTIRLVPTTQGPDRKKDPQGDDIRADPLPENPDDIYKRPGAGSGIQHRFVLAAQLQDASDLAWKVRAKVQALGGVFEGPIAQMVEFDRVSGRRLDYDDEARSSVRDPATGKEPPTWPTRTISGVQFFFPQSYEIGRSNVYFSFTPYALTSISQYQYWRQRSGPVGQLLGQISIDIGDWHSAYPEADPAKKSGPGHPAFYSSSQEVARGTWEQVVSGLSAAYSSVIQQPRYYHLDQNMVFSETIHATGDAPGWIKTGGVRANAILRVPQNTNPDASVALVPGRFYWAELRVGQGGDPIRTKTIQYDPSEDKPLRDLFFTELEDRANGRLLLAKAKTKSENLDIDIVVSPAPRLKSATLRVLGPSDKPFRLVVEQLDISVEARNPAEVVDALADALKEQAHNLVTVTRPAPDCLTLLPVEVDTIKIGVLNVDRMIELLDAPSLIVSTLNLEIPDPAEGFALIRNNYQYIIDVPGQWAYRPGLRRDRGGVPEGFAKLAADFGVKRAEIYYAHPESCPLLEKWVCAGAHMATYTRMTTMEAANESGRHAAAALIYNLHADAKRNNLLHYEALAGDFPKIFPVEDNEIDDLEAFKTLDDVLFDMGQPHLFEVIGLSQLVQAIQAGDYSLTQIGAKLAPLLASLPGLQIAAPEFAAKLGALLRRMVSGNGANG